MIRTRNPWVLRLRNSCAIGCAKNTEENVFNGANEKHNKIFNVIISACFLYLICV